MADKNKPQAISDEDLDTMRGGNLIDPWPVSVRAREDKKGILFFDEAEAVSSGKVINSETGKSEI
ncbi:MAG: hypothetical protein AAGH68_08760 [Pseudomonadota bacterium]